ncbi:coiled-coil domain-containing protein 34 isoform X1 [Crotalus tigris]|uniref:coiled-coil domain-containing protein 34 isoform X1 n=1 Tax=Crotalus tigris TaxID=88082 RepID=UPI00192F7492|nr:coiled-coil domain-containing protein 34 isoform X1 [Crotalus tigris]XP_039223042.1 coiled-coil domain-containing protein 34 isoform X1 [Crotalus tigris]XP_039223043.1 coiled-coil domain-containing protein 34 isoform X1 [Crotalus tigris]
MPTSEPPKSRREAVYSSPASSDDEGAGKSSTFSLVSDSFHPELSDFHHEGEGETTTSRGSSIPQKMKHHHSLEQIKDKNKHSPAHTSLSPWEEWFLCKERELRARFQAKALEEMNQQMEATKEKQERERKKLIAEEKHKEWVQRKNEEVKREKKERQRKLKKEIREKEIKEFEKIQLKEKAKEMYKEWLKKKNTEDLQKKKEEKEKEKLREAELQEKKEKSERMFKEWLQNSKNKPRPASAGYAYVNGKLATYPDGNAYPAPAFYNPIPWKPIPAPPPKEEKYVSVKKNKRPLSSHTHRSSSMLFQKSRSNIYLGSLQRLQK